MALAKLIDHENNNLIDGMVDYMVNGNSIYLSSCYPFIKTFQDLNDFNKIMNRLYSKKYLKRFCHYFYLNYARAEELWVTKAKRPDSKKSEINTTLYQKQYNKSMASKIFKENFTLKDHQEWSVKQWLSICLKQDSTTSDTTNTPPPSAKRPVNLQKGKVNTAIYQNQIDESYPYNKSMASKIFKKDFVKDHQKWSVKQWLLNCVNQNGTTSNTTNTPPSKHLPNKAAK